MIKRGQSLGLLVGANALPALLSGKSSRREILHSVRKSLPAQLPKVCFRKSTERILREGQGAIEIEGAIKRLRHENAKGVHIYIQPAGTHSLSLIDDLNLEAIQRMKVERFEPAVVIETSPNNFQAWLNHGQVFDAAMSTRAAKQLDKRFGGVGRRL